MVYNYVLQMNTLKKIFVTPATSKSNANLYKPETTDASIDYLDFNLRHLTFF